jgi:phosphatidylglycerophosphatase A
MTTDRALARLISTWFGCGWWPWGPGTAGSIAAVLIAVALSHWVGWSPLHIALLGFGVCVPGVWAAKVEGDTSGDHDPSHVVVDEVSGQWITFAGAAAIDWKWCLAALVLFRIFDIWKPAPVRQLERLPGGFGVMADDVMAGLYGAVVLALARWFTI